MPPAFLLSKFASQLKLNQSVMRVQILAKCITSSILRVLLSGFWVAISKSQGLISRVLGVRLPCSKASVQGSWVWGSRVQGPRVPGYRVAESRVSGSRIPRVPDRRVLDPMVQGSRLSRSWDPGFQVLILEYANNIDFNESNLPTYFL